MAATTADGNKVDDVVAEKSKKITLVSSDGEHFDITHEAARMSQTINHMIEDDCTENDIPLPNVKALILAKVIEYCNKHVATTGEQEDLESFDKKFIDVDRAMLFDIILAANYLEIKGLLDLSCQTAADMIKGKTVEQIREIFNLTNDFTPEEEEEIRKENPWAFE